MHPLLLSRLHGVLHVSLNLFQNRHETESRSREGRGLTSEKIRLATFDCYGTLIDWEGGAASFLYELARRPEPDPPPAQELGDRWESLQFERLRGGGRPYRVVLADMVPALGAARHAGSGSGSSPTATERPSSTACVHMDVEFEGVTVAEDCRAYKPSRGPFEHALRAIGLPPERILHVAFGFKYDIAPAQQLGLRTAWVNRHRDPPPGDARRDHEWSDLWPRAEVA
jgi:2-haloacid dehalogenase